MGDTNLKLVKVNQREEEHPTYRYGRTVMEKKKVHDMELHHPETGEPIFSVNKERGNGKYSLKWHPYMTSTHPELENSYEHGKNHHDYRHFNSESGKDYLGSHGGRYYDAAARSGFKDAIPTSKTMHATEEDPTAHRVHFHDPETGDKIVTKSSGYSGKVSFHGSYLDKHGIDHSLVPAASKNGPYQLAKFLHSQKGKSYSAIGRNSFGGHYSQGSRGSYLTYPDDHRTDVYRASGSKTDPELSAAHEAHLTGKHEGLKVERHSPTVFTATKTSGDTTHRHHSIVTDGNLYHHSFKEGEYYKGSTLGDKF